MDTNQWSMNFSEIDSALHCVFAGRLDGSACEEIEQGLLLRAAKFRKSLKNAHLAFDLSDVTFISSAFLRLCLIHLKTFGRDCFAVTNVSEEIYKIFHISGFVDIMNVTQRNTM